jgi:hypothetical protein
MAGRKARQATSCMIKIIFRSELGKWVGCARLKYLVYPGAIAMIRRSISVIRSP